MGIMSDHMNREYINRGSDERYQIGDNTERHIMIYD